MHFFGQFKDHNPERKHGNETKTVSNIHFYIWKWSKFIFSPPPLLWSIVVKYFNFEQKLPIGTVHHIFLESRHPEVTKNSYYVLYPKGIQKKVSANWLIPVCRCVYVCTSVQMSTISKSIPPLSAALLVLKIIWPLRFLPLFPRQTGIAHSSQTAFSEDILSWAEREGRGLWNWKITKINKDIGRKSW